MAKVSGYRRVLHQLALDQLQTSNSPRQYPDGKSPHSFLFRVLYQILCTNKTERDCAIHGVWAEEIFHTFSDFHNATHHDFHSRGFSRFQLFVHIEVNCQKWGIRRTNSIKHQCFALDHEKIVQHWDAKRINMWSNVWVSSCRLLAGSNSGQ